MIYISAGHHFSKIKPDPGAINRQGIKEADLTKEFRDLIAKELDLKEVKYIKDDDQETLTQYLNRIKTGNGSVVLEIHFDANDKPTPTGTTGLIEAEADRLDRAFAKELTDATASILGIKNRGVLTEAQSHRGSLGLMREEGIICLVEICFITNPTDLAAYHANKHELAKKHAEILIKYEAMI